MAIAELGFWMGFQMGIFWWETELERQRLEIFQLEKVESYAPYVLGIQGSLRSISSLLVFYHDPHCFRLCLNLREAWGSCTKNFYFTHFHGSSYLLRRCDKFQSLRMSLLLTERWHHPSCDKAISNFSILSHGTVMNFRSDCVLFKHEIRRGVSNPFVCLVCMLHCLTRYLTLLLCRLFMLKWVKACSLALATLNGNRAPTPSAALKSLAFGRC